MTSPGGITAARPPFCRLRFGVRALGFIDFGELGDLECLGLVLGGSEGRLEAFCILAGHLGWSFEALEAFFGASWGALEALLEPPGALLGPLGCLLDRLRGDQNLTKITCQTKVNLRCEGGSFPIYFKEGFGRPKSTKIGHKPSPNLTRFSRTKKLLFRSLLGPSWADLGAFWEPSWDQT